MRRLIPALLLVLWLGGCATAPPPGPGDGDDESDMAERIDDPFEATNRRTQAGFLWIDDHVMHPVADAYAEAVPNRLRVAIRNLLETLGQPAVVVNHLLQGNPDYSWTAFERLAVNAVAGVGGLFDVATEWNLPYRPADFGQTFGVWGVGDGPYIFLPFFGPSNPRDAVGLALGFASNPAVLLDGWEAAGALGGELAVGAVDGRSRRAEVLDRLRHESLDFYIPLRAVYYQNRRFRVEQGKTGH
ncbi:MAG TPA: VacJ family lipoprotein [Magnetospirillaceae bacterium]|nr:VacJ family lipoprotein [Magnetospirillaceae bacterium]